MEKTSPTPLLLLPGMGPDHRMFADQAAALPCLSVPAWLDPAPRETLSSYARRMAKVIDPGEPCFVGGASFGGLVALELTDHMRVLGCFLIGSVRSPKEFPKHVSVFRKVPGFSHVVPFELATLLSRGFLLAGGSRIDSYWTSLVRQLGGSNPSFLRWATRALLGWERPSGLSDVPVFHIHGRKDRMLPCELTSPNLIIEGGGHNICVSHPDDVTRFLRDCMGSPG